MHRIVVLLAGAASTIALAVGSLLAWPAGTGQPGALRVTALGDSVTSGSACACDAFPAVYGRLLARAEGVPAQVQNFGVGGQASGGLLARLRHDTDGVARSVRGADVVLVTIGANDFGAQHDQITSGRCTGPDCVSDKLATMRDNLTRILALIRALRSGPQATVLVTGYWNDFEDGAVARQRYPEAGLAAANDLTRRTNRAIREAIDRAAPDQRATYVHLETAFHRRGRDVTDLLAADGDHPNSLGHRLIARLLVRAGLPRLPAA